MNVKDANISDEVHMAPLDMNVIIISFLTTKINCISNFLNILPKKINKDNHKKIAEHFMIGKHLKDALFFYQNN